jgi:hypothetical protein
MQVQLWRIRTEAVGAGARRRRVAGPCGGRTWAGAPCTPRRRAQRRLLHRRPGRSAGAGSGKRIMPIINDDGARVLIRYRS